MSPHDAGLTCQELYDFIADYWEGELAGEALERFEGHLGICPDCVAYLDGYRQTAALGAHLLAGGDTLPEEVPDALVAAILDARRRQG